MKTEENISSGILCAKLCDYLDVTLQLSQTNSLLWFVCMFVMHACMFMAQVVWSCLCVRYSVSMCRYM